MKGALPIQSVSYPESDGKPMGETDWHRNAIIRLIELLQTHFAGQKVYVSGDLLLYYEQGNPKKYVVPDVFVVKDLLPKDRRVYKLWLERKPPNVVIEVTSRKTKKKDQTEKPPLYAKLGVKELFLFDPDADYLDPPLQGYRLGKSGYRPIAPDAEERLESRELGLNFKLDETGLQLLTPDGERLLTGREAAAQAKAEAARLAEENRRLREELARRKSSGK
jgi:Uma2 family endonuclease